MKKVSIIGAGLVGSNVALFTLLHTDLDKVYLFDIKKDKVEGECMDINQCMSSMDSEKECINGSLEGSDIVVICVGRRRVPGETRQDLRVDNMETILSVGVNIKVKCPNAKVLMVTNPSDNFTNLLKYQFDLDVIGIGTELDTARLVEHIHHTTGVTRQSIEAYAYGPHGEDMMFEGIDEATEIAARQIAINTISKKGATVFAPAMVVVNTIRRLL